MILKWELGIKLHSKDPLNPEVSGLAESQAATYIPFSEYIH